MDIFFSNIDRKQVIQLPIVPSEFKIQSPMNHETYTTISQGDIKLLGQPGLKNIVLASFFPVKKYNFARSKKYKGWEYVEIFESWNDKKIPIRLVATGTPINMLIGIDNFEYGVQDGSGDIYYSLSLSEFKNIKLKSKKV